MEIYRDFQELLALFNAHNVEYVIVGSYAMAAHGVPRYTAGIDLLVNPTAANAVRTMAAVNEFGFGATGLTEADFSSPGRVVQLGRAPVRIDILTDIEGVNWAHVDKGKIVGNYGGVPVWFIGRQEFVANKRAIGRHKDLGDLEALGEH